VSIPQPDHAGSVGTEVHPSRETTLDPEARSLYQVRIDHADEAGSIFETLMGDVVEPRREFIHDNAPKVVNLDVLSGLARPSAPPHSIGYSVQIGDKKLEEFTLPLAKPAVSRVVFMGSEANSSASRS